jgi:hypothetical protein
MQGNLQTSVSAPDDNTLTWCPPKIPTDRAPQQTQLRPERAEMQRRS